MKLIQIFALVAVLAVIPGAQAIGQSTDPAAPPTAKPSPQAGNTDSKKTDANGKNSKKPKAASKEASGQSSGIKVVPQTAPASGKSAPAKSGASAAGSKPAAPPGKAAAPSEGTSPSVKKTTGSTAVPGKATAASGPVATHPAGGQKKPPAPVVAVKPAPKQGSAPKQAPVQKSAATTPVRKSAATGSPFAGKTNQPKIVPKKPAKATIVAAAKTSSKVSAAGRRDPFVSPIRNVSVATPSGPVSCATGKRCLAIAELTVQGTAKDTDGKMMAIIARGSNHPAYFLRENDQIFNGNVVKITCDSVTFREYATDVGGKQTAHEVVKNVFSGSEAHKCRSSQ